MVPSRQKRQKRQKPSSLWRWGKILPYSILLSVLSMCFWMLIYWKSRHNENFAYYGSLDGIPLGLVLKIFKGLQIHETLSITILCAQAVSLLFWNFVAFIFSVRLRWVAFLAIALDVVPGAILLAENSAFHGSPMHFQGQAIPRARESNQEFIASTKALAADPTASRIQTSALPGQP